MIDDYDEPDLGDLEDLFDEAVDRLGRGRIDEAKALHKRILEREPRLPEPYLELAVILHGEGDLESAIAAARLGVELLEKGGQWLDTLAPNVVLAHAKNLLGRLLVEWSQEGERIFDKEEFPRVWNQAVALFNEAHALDPDNEDARTNAVLHKPLGDEPTIH